MDKELQIAITNAISFEKKGNSLITNDPEAAIAEYNNAIAVYYDSVLFPYPNSMCSVIAKLFSKKSKAYYKLSLINSNNAQKYRINSKVDKFVAQSFKHSALVNRTGNTVSRSGVSKNITGATKKVSGTPRKKVTRKK
jgi:hypothetical protein